MLGMDLAEEAAAVHRADTQDGPMAPAEAMDRAVPTGADPAVATLLVMDPRGSDKSVRCAGCMTESMIVSQLEAAIVLPTTAVREAVPAEARAAVPVAYPTRSATVPQAATMGVRPAGPRAALQAIAMLTPIQVDHRVVLLAALQAPLAAEAPTTVITMITRS